MHSLRRGCGVAGPFSTLPFRSMHRPAEASLPCLRLADPFTSSLIQFGQRSSMTGRIRIHSMISSQRDAPPPLCSSLCGVGGGAMRLKRWIPSIAQGRGILVPAWLLHPHGSCKCPLSFHFHGRSWDHRQGRYHAGPPRDDPVHKLRRDPIRREVDVVGSKQEPGSRRCSLLRADKNAGF